MWAVMAVLLAGVAVDQPVPVPAEVPG